MSEPNQQSDTPRTSAMVAELYEDAAKRKKTPGMAVRDPFDRALELCYTLERELSAMTAQFAEATTKLSMCADACNYYHAQLAEARTKYDAAVSLYQEEKTIVSKIWAMFGNPSYESLKGRSIYDLIAEARMDQRMWFGFDVLVNATDKTITLNKSTWAEFKPQLSKMIDDAIQESKK